MQIEEVREKVVQCFFDTYGIYEECAKLTKAQVLEVNPDLDFDAETGFYEKLDSLFPGIKHPDYKFCPPPNHMEGIVQYIAKMLEEAPIDSD